MESNRPTILISNDDGYEAKGLNELINFLRPLGNIFVMAPDSARSGMSCAITADKPVKYSLVHKEEGLVIYKCTGTPVDCIKLANYAFPDLNPGLIVAGINHGENAAVNVHYSGTMGVVIEGCLRGIPSIGFSICDHNLDADFSATGKYVQTIVKQVLDKRLPDGICLNVNFPMDIELKGMKACRQTIGKWENEWERRRRPNGGDYFWLTGDFVNYEPQSEDTDHWALSHGYVAVTPIKIDMTAYEMINVIANWDIE